MSQKDAAKFLLPHNIMVTCIGQKQRKSYVNIIFEKCRCE